MSRPHDGWSEQDPADWIAAAEAVLDRLAAEHDLCGVRGIGLSGQMHGATLLDDATRCCGPASCGTTRARTPRRRRLDADPELRRITGNIVFPGFTAPKLAWVRRHEPEVFGRVAKVLLPKDYLRLWLTGEHVAEMSDAAGTAGSTPAARDWSDELLAATGLSRDQMPRLVEGSEVSGTLRGRSCGPLGPADAGTVGRGRRRRQCGLGRRRGRGARRARPSSRSAPPACSSPRTTATGPTPETAVHTFCHALPDTWHQMGVILAATDALNWFARLAGTRRGRR